MFNKIKNKILSLIYIAYHIIFNQNSVKFSSIFNKQTTLEGRNLIYSRVLLVNSFVGFATYISSDCVLPNTKIGKYCSIAKNCKIIVGEHPTSDFVSTHPLFYSNKKFSGLYFKHYNIFNEYKYTDESKKYFCEIGNDVWIGEDVKILSGVIVGDGVIIATGSVVTKNVPSFSIIGGVPAKIIKYRFDINQIDFLEKFKWWNMKAEWINSNVQYFSNIDKLIESERTSHDIKN